jgi:DNA-binding SARP family transcriptional activator
MPSLSVRMLGKFSLRRNEEAVRGLDGSKLQELFCYLVIHRNSPHPRESLAALLWGDGSTARSKKYLRKALWQVQSALDYQNCEGQERILQVEPDWVSLNPTAEIWLDVAEFEQAFSEAREVAGQHLDTAVAQALDHAVQLYRGDLLEGFYQDWCLCERERLQSNYLIMLDKMMSYCEAHHKYETGLGYGLQVLRYDRARESTHRRLMRLYYMLGDRTGALRQYDHCVAALEGELGVKPGTTTVRLYEQMRAEQFPGVAPPPVIESAPDVTLEVLEHLKQLRQRLTEIQRQVQQDIQAVDLVLGSRR